MISVFLLLCAGVIFVFTLAIHIPYVLRLVDAKRGREKPNVSYETRTCAVAVWLTVVMAFAAFVFPFFQYQTVSQGATDVAVFEEKSLYYNQYTDSYFTVELSHWNPIRPFYRQYIDKEDAESIKSKMQQYEELHSDIQGALK